MSEISQAIASAKGRVAAARTALRRERSMAERQAALASLREAQEALSLAIEARARTRRAQPLRISASQQVILDLHARIEALEDGPGIIRAGLEIAEAEDSLADWMDDARDYLETLADGPALALGEGRS